VRHVLAHASGLAADTPEAQKPPGARRIYSNAGYELLGTLLSDRTGFTAQQYVHEAVFEPLGMRSTTLIGSPASAAHSCVRDLLSFVDALARPGLIDSTTLADMLANQFGDIEGVTPGFGNQRPNSWGLGPERHGNKSHHWMPPEASPETVGHFGQSGTFFWFDPIRNLVLIGLGRVRFGAWAVELWPRLGTLAGEILSER
jgi:CubicO group peptidase (beta-lactamase class C family)